MSKYRIIEYNNPFFVTFKVQKRSFFGWWYNFENVDACITGYYDTVTEARDAIDRHRSKTKMKIIGA